MSCFLYINYTSSFSVHAICTFWQKEIGRKGDCKMLVKLTAGLSVQFKVKNENIFQKAVHICHSVELYSLNMF
jgi:hypothetical protein